MQISLFNIEEKFSLSRRLWRSSACFFLWEFDDKYGMIDFRYIKSNADRKYRNKRRLKIRILPVCFRRIVRGGLL